MDIHERFCPVCKNKNSSDAVVCGYCGAALENHILDSAVITSNTGLDIKSPETIDERLMDEALVPLGGIAIYILDTTHPMFLYADEEITIGRKVEPASEVMLDLSDHGGYLLGLSRRHAKIRRAGVGYEVIDLGSTNGTWLNGEKLEPHQAYPLTSGARLRLGRMRFFVLYRVDVATGQKR